MNNRLLALALIIRDFLEMDPVKLIDEENGRVQIQKLVYLLQCCGANFGYTFSWYKRGPYSSSLTSDYYDLRNELSADCNSLSISKVEFSESQLPTKLRSLVTPPSEFKPDENRRKEFWLELVASLHYLTHLSDFDPEKVDHVLATQKPYLVYTPEMKEMTNQALQEAGL
jgi:uncharacterized protein YwgA